MDWVRGFAYTGEVVKRLDPTAAERALGRLRAALVTHLSDDGVLVRLPRLGRHCSPSLTV